MPSVARAMSSSRFSPPSPSSPSHLKLINCRIGSLTHCLESKSYQTLIHGLKQTSTYEIASEMGYEKTKNWQLEHS